MSLAGPVLAGRALRLLSQRQLRPTRPAAANRNARGCVTLCSQPAGSFSAWLLLVLAACQWKCGHTARANDRQLHRSAAAARLALRGQLRHGHTKLGHGALRGAEVGPSAAVGGLRGGKRGGGDGGGAAYSCSWAAFCLRPRGRGAPSAPAPVDVAARAKKNSCGRTSSPAWSTIHNSAIFLHTAVEEAEVVARLPPRPDMLFAARTLFLKTPKGSASPRYRG